MGRWGYGPMEGDAPLDVQYHIRDILGISKHPPLTAKALADHRERLLVYLKSLPATLPTATGPQAMGCKALLRMLDEISPFREEEEANPIFPEMLGPELHSFVCEMFGVACVEAILGPHDLAPSGVFTKMRLDPKLNREDVDKLEAQAKSYPLDRHSYGGDELACGNELRKSCGLWNERVERPPTASEMLEHQLEIAEYAKGSPEVYLVWAYMMMDSGAPISPDLLPGFVSGIDLDEWAMEEPKRKTELEKFKTALQKYAADTPEEVDPSEPVLKRVMEETGCDFSDTGLFETISKKKKASGGGLVNV